MKKSLDTRHLGLVPVSVYLLLLTACSYGANFIVVNASNSAIEVRYKTKSPSLPIGPAVLPTSQLGEQVPWQDLSPSEFTFDPDTSAVVVSVKPGYALLIDRLSWQDDTQLAADLSIVEIDIKGAAGEIKFQGEQVFKHFMADAKKGTRILTYK